MAPTFISTKHFSIWMASGKVTNFEGAESSLKTNHGSRGENDRWRDISTDSSIPSPGHTKQQVVGSHDYFPLSASIHVYRKRTGICRGVDESLDFLASYFPIFRISKIIFLEWVKVRTGARGSVVVEALCYKLEGRGFASR
jgi:hypothetical protein